MMLNLNLLSSNVGMCRFQPSHSSPTQSPNPSTLTLPYVSYEPFHRAGLDLTSHCYSVFLTPSCFTHLEGNLC